MTPYKARAAAKRELSAKRFYHTKCVARAARKLACRNGVSVRKAATAAYLHDIFKERPQCEQLQILLDTAIIGSIDFDKAPRVAHGFAGAEYIKKLGVDDKDIVSAVRWHTTGRQAMSTLEKVIFVADGIGHDRTYDGVDDLRRLARDDLDAAVLVCLRRTIKYNEDRGRYVVPVTCEAAVYLENERKCK